jgi:hypothetical protein
MRFLDRFALVPVIEAKDYGSAGITSDSFKMSEGASFSLLVSFGAITGNSTLIIYGGATLAAVTTGLAFRYRLATGVFKAVASADQYDAAVAVALTGLTLTDTTFKNRTMVIDIDAAEMADTLPYITAVVSSTATVLLMSALVVIEADRYQPAVTNIV